MSGTIGDPEGPRASQFAVILDAPITLAVGADVDRTFEFHTFSKVFESDPAIVSFLLVRAEDLQLEVTLNDLSFTRDYSPGPERSIHEVIGPAARKFTNQLTLRVHRGSCRISDIVVWYQVGP
jgi:hypothetical protein